MDGGNMAAKKKSAKKKQSVETKTKKPAQSRLPGMEDAAIEELESLAEQYADVRDNRIALSKREGEMQDDLAALLRKHKKTEYHHLDVHIWIVAVDEKVKVKIGELKPNKKERVVEKSESGSEDDIPADNEPAPGPNVNAESMVEHGEA
jgi:hypothetical protein